MTLKIDNYEKDNIPMSYAGTAIKALRAAMKDYDKSDIENIGHQILTYATKKFGFEILKVECFIIRNPCLERNRIADGTFDLDVHFTVKAYDGYSAFYIAQMCLSDVWNIVDSLNDDVRNDVFVKKFSA